jgi:hypothetical protein
LFAEVGARLAAITIAHKEMDYRKATTETRALWTAANGYLTRTALDNVPILTF